jgi:hypothetical protein
MTIDSNKAEHQSPDMIKEQLVPDNAPSSVSMDSKVKTKFGEKTKLSLINGVFDVTLLINLIKDFTPLLAKKEQNDQFWHVKLMFITVLFVLQIIVFAILSLITIVRDKSKLERMNNMVLFLSSFIFLFEFIRSRFYMEITAN